MADRGNDGPWRPQIPSHGAGHSAAVQPVDRAKHPLASSSIPFIRTQLAPTSHVALPMAFLFWFFGGALGLQIGYWLLVCWGFRRARQRDPSQKTPLAKDPASTEERSPEELPPLSVIVAARDEEEDLPALLTALRQQTHPCFEVVVADDDSLDATPRLVREWLDALPAGGGVEGQLVPVCDPRPPRKKHALTQAIEAARYPLLVFTDADCAPPPGWLTALARAHALSKQVADGCLPLLLGYSPYRAAPAPARDTPPAPKAPLLNRFARYETFLAGVLTAGACGLDRPYMAVGRNISYSKRLFDRIGGFAHSAQSMSGDDDLLVQEVHRRRAAPVHHVFGAATYVKTDAPRSWHSWLKQKRRHASAGRFYAPAASAHLTAFNLSGVLLWLAPFVLGWTGVGLLAGKLLAQFLAAAPAARTFEESDLLPGLPLWDFGYALYNLLVVPLGLLSLPDEW